jgi:DNA-directed RNA polymerase specialized sigma24 family protein
VSGAIIAWMVAGPGTDIRKIIAEGRIARNNPPRDPDLWLYRDRTRSMLRRYLRYSMEVGRLPSLLGREFFRTHVTSYSVGTFEDAVIFVHDVEKVLQRLETFDQALIAKIVFQDHNYEETARLLNCGKRTVGRRFPDALDRLTELFLEVGLLERMVQLDD